MIFLCIAGIVLCDTVAVSMLKASIVTHRARYLALGYVCYLLVGTLLYQSFRYESVVIVNVLWSASSVLFVLVVGRFFFGERIRRGQMVAVALTLLGVILLRIQGI